MKIKLLLQTIILFFVLSFLSEKGYSQTLAGGDQHSAVLCSSGIVKTTGYNGYGNLGNGSFSSVNSPVQVSGLTNVIAIASGSNHIIALKSDGTVWAWGYNGYGNLGDSTYSTRTTPVQVRALSGIVAIGSCNVSSYAVKSDGTLWAWGQNNYGQLGDGTTTNSNFPVQVLGLTGVTAVAAGYYHALALKSNGTVFSWGYNGNGELGNGGYTDSHTAGQINSLTGITAIAANYLQSMVLKSNGTAWSWGYNGYGQLGDGTYTTQPSPVQVTTLTGITAIAMGYTHTLAIKNNGTAWSWGYNGYGQLGDGTTTGRNFPAQVIGLTSVSKLGFGGNHSLFQKNDGSTWVCGYNYYGQLGDASSISRSLPVKMHDCCSNLPSIGLAVNCITMDTTVLTASSTKTFKIYNTACGSLVVSSFTITNAVFWLTPNFATVNAFDSTTVTVHYSPTVLGSNTGILTIHNNDHDTTICLSGYCTAIPAISVSPTFYNVTVPCGDTMLSTLHIINTGSGNLNYHISDYTRINIALVAAEANSNYITDVKNKLLATGKFNIVDIYNGYSMTPTLAQLEQYQAVLVWSNNSFTDPVTLGNNLANYVDAGGGVVTAFWVSQTTYITGRFNTSDYWCMDPGLSYTTGQASLGTVYNSNSPIMAGVTSFNGGTTSWRPYYHTIDPLATRVADWSDGAPLIVTRTIGGTNRVDLGFWPVSNDVYSGDWLPSTNGALIMANSLIYSANRSGWLHFAPTAGTATAGNTSNVTLKFDSRGMVAGIYHDTIHITSNDPNTPLVNVPVTMDIVGTAHIHISLFNTPTNCLNLDSIMAFTTSRDSMAITNTGCDTLRINSTTISPTIYSVISCPTVIPPGITKHIIVQFAPVATGTFTGSLTLHTNIVDTAICLTGKGYPPPTISTSPTSFNVSLACSDSLTSPLVIHNTGGAPLTYTVGLQNPNFTSALPIPASCSPQTTGTCCNMGIYNVTFGTINNTTGNATQGYQNYTATQSTFVSPGQTYTLSVQTGNQYAENVGVWIDFNNDGIFEAGEQVMSNLNTLPNQIHTGTVTIPVTAVKNKAVRMRVGSEYSPFPAPQPCNNVTYGQFEDYTIKISAVATVSSYSGTVGTGSSSTINVNFNSTGLNAGVYTGNIVINSNDPLNNPYTVPYTVHVGGSGTIALTRNCLNLDSIMQYTTHTDSLYVKNIGCDTLKVNNITHLLSIFTPNQTVFNVLPGDSAKLKCTFAPTAVGSFTDTLTILNNNVTKKVCLSGKCFGRPIMTTTPTSLTATLACCDSVTDPVVIHNTGGGSPLIYSVSNVQNFSEGFENGLGRWVTGGTTGSNWMTVTDAHTGTHSLKEGPIGNYANNDNQYIQIAQPLNITNAATAVLSFWSKSSMECCCDAYRVELSVNGGAYTILSTLNCSQPTWLLNSISLTPYVVNGDNIIVRFLFTSDYSVTYGGVEIDDILITGTQGLPDWLSVSPNGATVTPGNTSTVNVKFKSCGKPVGTYSQNLIINSNDPLHPVDTIPLTFHVVGAGYIALTRNCLNLDSIMQYTTHTDSLYIKNTGCDTLHVTNITNQLSIFTVNQTVYNILPGDSAKLKCTFAPVAVGTFTDTLTILNSNVTKKVCLIGKCFQRPIITATPDSINVSVSCGDSVLTTLTIHNTGGSILNWNGYGSGGSGSAPSGYCIPTMYPSNSSYYINSVTTTGANVNITTPVDAGFTSISGPGISYFSSSLVSQDPGGSFTLNVQAVGGTAYISVWVDWNRNGVFDANERVVNNIFTGNVLTNFTINIPINASTGYTRMRIIDWTNGSAPAPCGALSGWYGEAEDYPIRVGSPGFSMVPTSGSVNPSSSQSVQLDFNSTGLNPGVYYYPITINSNDPLNPTVSVYASMTVVGTGHISLSRNCINLDSIMQYTTHIDSLYIRNTGCDTLKVTNITNQFSIFSVNQTVFNILPGDSAKLKVTFAPVAVGSFTDTLTILNNDITKKVCLSGKGFARPIISTNPSSLTATLSCCDSSTVQLHLLNTGGSNLNYHITGRGFGIVGDTSILVIQETTEWGVDMQSFLLTNFGRHSTKISSSQIAATNFNLYDIIIVCGDENNTYYNNISSNKPKFEAFANTGGIVQYQLGNSVGSAVSIVDNVNVPYGYSEQYNTALLPNHPIVNGLPTTLQGNNANTGYFVNLPLNAQIITETQNSHVPTTVEYSYGSGLVIATGMAWGYSYMNGYNSGPMLTNACAYSISKIGILPSWLSLQPSTGTSIPSGSSTTNVKFKSCGLLPGIYSTNIIVHSNDPLNKFDSINCVMNVNGTGIISLNENCLNLDSIMAYTSRIDSSLVIKNTGCDTLNITNITHQTSLFSANPTSFIILPGDSARVTVTFSPITTGTFTDSLTILNNNVTRKVCLSGKGYPKPVQCHSPNSLNIHFTICQDSISRQINVCNTNGGSNLNWNLSTSGGKSALFDGSTEYINLPDNLILNHTSITLGAWFKTSSSGVIFGYQTNSYPTNPGQYVPILYIGTDGKLHGEFYQGGSNNITTSGVVNDGNWHQVTLTGNINTQSMYLDGALVGTLAGTINNLSMSKNQIGGGYGPGWPFFNGSWSFFNGRIDEVRIFNYPMSQVQIQNTMNIELTGNEVGLLGYWNFNNGTALDLSPNFNDGTVAGNTSFSAPNAPLGSSFVSFIPTSGTISVGGNTTVNAEFYKTGQNPGVHNYNIYLNSNDPLNGVDTIPVTETIDSVAPAPPTSADVSVCFGNSVPHFTATGNAGDTIKWYNSSMVLQHIGTTFNTGQTAVGIYTYYVTATDSINGCASRKDTVHLHINSAPIRPTAADQSVCFGNTIPALSSTGTIQLWYSNPGLTNHLFTGNPYNTGMTAAGTYTYYVSDSTSGCPKSPADTVTLTIHALPSKPVANDVSACFGAAIPALTAAGTGNDTIKWYNSALAFLQNGNPLVTGLTSPGIYPFYVTQTDSLLGCISPRDTAVLTIHFTPQPTANNQTACFGSSSSTLTATGTNLKWYNSAMVLMFSGNPYNTGLTAVGVDTFYVTQTLNGCESSPRMVILTINPLPSTPIAPDMQICFGQTTPLLTASGASVQWYSDPALTTLVHSGSPYNTGLTGVGNYIFYVTQSALGCASHPNTVHFNIGPIPVRPITADENGCFGFPTPDLIAASTGSDTVKWYTNPNLTSLTYMGNPFNTGQTAIGTYTYYLTQTDTSSGCVSFSDTVTLVINSTPVQPTAGDVNACFGQTIPALTSTGTIIQWYSDASLTNLVHIGNTYNTGITAVGSYPFYVKDSTAGCASSTADTATLTIYPIPTVPTTSGNASICIGQSNPTFTATGTNINWYSDAGLTSLVHTGSPFTPAQNAAGVYTFYVTQTVNGCSSPASTVIFTIYYTAPVTVSSISIPFGTATPDFIAVGSNINWYNSSMVNVSTNDTFATGQTTIGAYTYYVTQTLNGCQSTYDTVVLTIHPLAPVSTNRTICFGNTVPDLTATGTNINWYSDALLTTLVHSGNTFPTGQTAVGVYNYYVTQTVNNIPSPATIVTLTINAIPTAPVSSNQSACFGGVIPSLTATGTNVQWYDTTAIVYSGNPYSTGMSSIGVYNYTVTQTVNGCESPHSNVSLTINSLPSTPTSSNMSSCFGSATPSLSAAGTNITWYNSIGNQVGTGSPYATGITAAGVYTFEVTQTNPATGCQSLMDTVSLTINYTPPPVNADVSVCSGLTVPSLTATGTNIQWYNSSMSLVASGSSYSTGQTAVGTYTYFVTQTNTLTSCQSIPDSVILTINAVPFAPTSSNTNACFGQTIPALSATGIGIQWYGPGMTLLSSGNSFNTGQTAVGTYTYYATQTAGGCQGPADTVTLTIYPTPVSPATSGNSSICFGQTNPTFTATGIAINWYSDSTLTTLVQSGNTYTPLQTAPGVYTYYVTQNINGCSSPVSIVVFTIYYTPPVSVSDISIPFGTLTPDLIAVGSNITWYDTAMVTVSTNDSFATGQTAIGVYTYYVSQTMNGCQSTLDTAVLTIYPSNPPASNQSACFGTAIPDLSATGVNIRWYSDSLLTTLVYSGNPFTTGQTAVGVYTYYVTQSINGLQSTATTVNLTINAIPPAPVSSSLNSCFGGAIPSLSATGTSIQWYDTTVVVFSGNPYSTGQTIPGVYSYSVTQTVSGCESPHTSVTLTINALPVTPVANDTAICFGSPTPDLTSTGVNIKWYDTSGVVVGTGSPFATGITSPGIHTFYVTQTNTLTGCESQRDTVNLTIHFTPPPVAPDVYVCALYSVPPLTATGNNIQWYDSSMTFVASGSSFNTGQTAIGNHVYFVTQTDLVTGCTSIPDSVVLSINPIPSAPVTSNAVACFGQSITPVTATGSNLQWYGDNTLTTVLFSGNPYNTGQTAVGTYTYYVTQTTFGCQSPADSVTLTIYPTPVMPTTSGSVAICFGQTNPTFTATGTNVQWYSDSTLTTSVASGNSFTPSQTIAGTYTYYVTQSSNGCSSPYATVVFTIHLTPPVSASNANAIFGSPIPDLIAIGTNVTWYDTAMVVVSTNDTFATGQTAIGVYTYYVTQNMNSCESTPDTVVLTIYPGAPAVASQTVCAGNTVPDLTAVGSNIHWYNNALLDTLVFSGSPFATGRTSPGNYIYYATQTVNGIQSPAAPDTLTINSVPDAPIATSQAVCFGGTVPDLITAGINIKWYDTAMVNVSTLDTFATGQTAAGVYVYTVTTTTLGCESAHDTVSLTINALPATPVSSDVSVCFGMSVPDLTATGNNIQWYDTASVLVGTGSPFATGMTASGIYAYHLIDLNIATGCSSHPDTATLTINVQPNVPPVVANVVTCTSLATPDLVATSGTIVHWYSDALLTNLVHTGNTYTTGQTTAGSYSYYVTDSVAGCAASPVDTAMLTINTQPVTPPAVADIVVCSGGVIPDLVATTGNIVNWYSDTLLTNLVNTGFNFPTGQTAAGTYTYYVNDNIAGCPSGPTDTATLTIHQTPAMPTANDTAICFRSAVAILIYHGLHVQWYDTSMTLVHTGDVFHTGHVVPGIYPYYVTQTDTITGCVSLRDSVNMIIYNLPAPPIVTDTTVCASSIIPNLTSTGTNVQWYDTAGVLLFSGNTFTTGQTLAGTYIYHVIQTDTITGCGSSSDTSHLVIKPIPAAPFANSLAVCTGNPVPSFTSTGTNVNWYSNAGLTTLVNTGNTFNTGQTSVGVYTYYLTDSLAGCASIGGDSASLTINQSAVKPTARDTTICYGTVATLTSSGANPHWYSDFTLINLIGTGNSINTGTTAVGTYPFYVSDYNALCGSSIADTAHLTINPAPLITANTYSVGILVGGNTTLTAYNAVTYSWAPPTGLNVTTGPTVIASPTVTTTYTVTGTNAQGCSSDTTITVMVNHVGITEITIPLSDINLYPNPAIDAFTVEFSTTINTPIDIYLFNTLGQKMTEINVENAGAGLKKHKYEINTATLDSGVYSVEIVTQEGKATRRMVIIK